MKEFIETIVTAIVDKPEELAVFEIAGDPRVVYELKVAKEDMGKVIGKNGNIIRAIRALLNDLAQKNRKKVTLEVL